MPTPVEVREQLTDIVVRVLHCPADAVVPDAVLKTDLGVDSLTVVEIGEELGRRFDIYLSDDTIDELVTVDDAIQAVVHQTAPAPVIAAAAPAAAAAPTEPAKPAPDRSAPRLAGDRTGGPSGPLARFVMMLAIIGGSLGLVFGLGGAALVGATGIGSVDLPPLTMPTATKTATPSPTPTPTPTPTSADKDVVPEPTLSVSSSKVAPGERFGLEGAFPALSAGAALQVQVKDPGGEWDDFPVATKTRGGGAYKTQIYTSRTGERKFRMLHKKTNKASPAVTVEIG